MDSAKMDGTTNRSTTMRTAASRLTRLNRWQAVKHGSAAAEIQGCINARAELNCDDDVVKMVVTMEVIVG